MSQFSVTVSSTLEENKNTKQTVPVNRPDSSMDFSQSTTRAKNKSYDPFLVKGIETVGSIFTSLSAINAGPRLPNLRNKNKQPVVQPTMDNYSLVTNNNYIDIAFGKSITTPDALKMLPNQISSLFLSDSAAVKNNWQEYKKEGIDFSSSDETSLMFLYNYSTLFYVEYQDGYKKNKDGKSMINNPVWKTMSSRAVIRVQAGEILLCRLVKYENHEMGIEHPKILDLPIIDEYFFLVKNESILQKSENPAPKKKNKRKPEEEAIEELEKEDKGHTAFATNIIKRAT